MPNMAATVTAIYRYPVKGLSAEKLGRVALTPGECLPHDRRFAIALGSTLFDPEHPVWLSKTHFIMLMRDEKLAQLRTRFDGESGILAIVEDGEALLRAVDRAARMQADRGVLREFPRRRSTPAAAGRCGAWTRLCRRSAQAECNDRSIRLTNQPGEYCGT